MNGVSTTSPTYSALAVVMLVLCVTFVLSWLLVVVKKFGDNVVAHAALVRSRERGPVMEQWVAPAAATATGSATVGAGGGGAVKTTGGPSQPAVPGGPSRRRQTASGVGTGRCALVPTSPVFHARGSGSDVCVCVCVRAPVM